MSISGLMSTAVSASSIGTIRFARFSFFQLQGQNFRRSSSTGELSVRSCSIQQARDGDCQAHLGGEQATWEIPPRYRHFG